MTSPSTRSFTIKANDQGETFEISISEPASIKSLGLSLNTWGSSPLLANLLHKFKPLFCKAIESTPSSLHHALPVLELGAGTSVVGLASAVIYHTDVLVTDLAEIVPGMSENVRINQKLLSGSNGSARCGTLDWAQPREIRVFGDDQADTTISVTDCKARVILSADTVYDPDHPFLLTDTITTWMARDSTALTILAYPVRIAYVDYLRELWERLEAAGLECVEEGKEPGDGSFDDLAPYEWCIWKWKSLGESSTQSERP